MSLINEALKKAQGPRSTNSGRSTEAPSPSTAGKDPVPPRRSRLRYLWGFLLSVLIVGILSTAFTSFFIWQLLEEEEAPQPPARESVAADNSVPETPLPEKEPSPAPTEDLSGEAPPLEPLSSPPSTHTEPPPPPQPPDPAVVARLLELEIRGVMSGGTRILLYDQATDLTKAYRKGEALEGSVELTIEIISETSIEFKDHAGNLHTKSF